MARILYMSYSLEISPFLYLASGILPPSLPLELLSSRVTIRNEINGMIDYIKGFYPMKKHTILALVLMLGLVGQQATASSYDSNAKDSVYTIISGNTVSFLEDAERLYTNNSTQREFFKKEGCYINLLKAVLTAYNGAELNRCASQLEIARTKYRDIGMQASMIYGLMATAALGTGSAVLYQTYKNRLKEEDTTGKLRDKDARNMIHTVEGIHMVAGGGLTLAGLYALYKATIFM